MNAHAPPPRPSGESARLATQIAQRFAAEGGRELHRDDTSAIWLKVGAGGQDDCAVLGLEGSIELVLGSDYVRGVKFDMYAAGFLSLRDLGRYLVAANASDLAAMGASPLALLSVVRYPPEMSDEEFGEVLDGISLGCEEAGLVNVGGDIGSAERLILSASAIGACSPGRTLLRRGLGVGDHIFVSGTSGTAAAAMAWLAHRDQLGLPPSTVDELVGAWRHPKPAMALGKALGLTDGVTACLDTSDGLGAGLRTLAEQSAVRIDVDGDAIPLARAVGEVARALSLDPLGLAMSTSVDFRLLFGVADERLQDFASTIQCQFPDVARIGQVTAEGTAVAVHSGGEEHRGLGWQWDHGEGPSNFGAELRRQLHDAPP